MANEELHFVVYEGAREVDRFHWDRHPLLIGRHNEAQLRTEEPTLSARHAEITSTEDGVRLRDLGSLNGTQVNGHRIFDTMLKPGDRIEVGGTTILIRRPEDDTEPRIGTSHVVQEEDTGQTVRVRLDELRTRREPELGEDPRILALRDLFEALRTHDDSEHVFAEVRRVLETSFEKARVFVLRENAEGVWHDPATEARPSMSFVIEAARSDSAILSTSLPSDSRFEASVSARITGIQTAIAAPAWCEGEVRAIIYLDRLANPPFSRRDLNLLGIAANHISAVLENVERIRALKQTREALAELNRGLEATVAERTAELRRQAEEIQALAQAKEELLGIAAHDIRGPLTVMQGTIELLQARIGQIDRAAVKSSLDIVHDATRSLSQLLSELLDAKAIETGRIHLDLRRYRISTVLGQVFPITRLAAENKEIEICIKAPPGLEVYADVRRLAQAITNLVLNAIKFSEPGTKISVSAETTVGDGVMIVVEDQGVGIPRNELNELFTSFTQGEAGRLLGGSGLGLMISKRLIELHGGSLDVRSKVGVGTRFMLALPG